MDLPGCPKFRNKDGCPRSQPIMLKENETHYAFGCETCKTVFVVSKPFGKAKARYENEIERLGKLHSWDKKRLFWHAPVGGWR